jgi:streptomycin 6-kinase
VQRTSDEWHAGRVAQALEDHGGAIVLECADGAVLLERILPGRALTELAVSGHDQQATEILVSLIDRMSHATPPDSCKHAEEWATGFDRYLQSGASDIPTKLVTHARETYLSLCKSQRRRRLLHGDLHHANVLLDDKRGWLAIDPKGVVGETEFEIGVALRNPVEHPELFASRDAIEKRMEGFVTALDLDYERTRQWAFSQAVLSAIWAWEDASPPIVLETFLNLARTIL